MSKLPSKYPTYITTIPSSGVKVKYRPYTIAEEKKILIALEQPDDEVVQINTAEVINECIFHAFKSEDLNLSDFMYLFLQIKIRAQASKVVKLHVVAEDCERDDCPVDLVADLDLQEMPLQVRTGDTWVDVTPDTTPKDTKQFVFYDDFGAMFRQPRILDGGMDQDRDTLIAKCLVAVFEGENLYENFTKEEALEWVAELIPTAKEEVSDWLDSLPILRKVCTFSCDVCKQDTKVPIEGLSNFFD